MSCARSAIESSPAVMRDCVDNSLPNVLILHLKRFELDYNTFETVKVNDACSFPFQLDLGPFTHSSLQQQRIDDDMDSVYELCSILVHRGVANGGHYYSLIKTRDGRDTWMKFNDEVVTPFDVTNIPGECFGGLRQRRCSDEYVQCESNAYMLFYEKPDRQGNFPVMADTSGENESDNSTTHMVEVMNSNARFAREKLSSDTWRLVSSITTDRVNGRVDRGSKLESLLLDP